MDILSISQLICRYGNIVAVDGIDFGIKKGEFIGIIGPNGSGKSTILKAIMKSIKPESGNIYLRGTDTKHLKAKQIAQSIAVVPDETHVSFAFTAFDVVMMGRMPYLGRFDFETKKDEEIVEECTRRTGTIDLKERFINELSSGERQRVIIAQALAQEPDIILLDEPTTHLDINHEVGIFDLLKDLKKKMNLTIIAVLHDLNIASLYCDRLLLLKEGKLVIEGSPDKVITEENIGKVYKTDVSVKKHPKFDTPYVMLLPSSLS
ncbi:MAG: ABC transporter ATP-binding protein [bacterium]